MWKYFFLSSLEQIVGDYFITAPTHLSADILQSKNVTVYIYHFSYLSALDQDRSTFIFF